MSIEEVSTSEKYNYNKGDYVELKKSLNKVGVLLRGLLNIDYRKDFAKKYR